MAQNYEEIVREWYLKLKPEFLRRLTDKYSGLSLYDAENLYQDAFIAVHRNLKEGRVQENTSWRNYILTIGMNLASHEWRKIERGVSVNESNSEDDNKTYTQTSLKMERKIQELYDEEGENTLYSNPEAIRLLGDELDHIPEPCKSIIKLYYFSRCSMTEIAEEVGYKNSTTAKSKKLQCMKDLMRRVKESFSRAGMLN